MTDLMERGLIAWFGELLMLEAKWNDKDGHMVKFKIMRPDDSKPNPFKQFTKRRKGHAGTRFFASVTHVQMPKAKQPYAGEFMLAGWGDSSTQGYTVTFWCEPPDAGMHAFDGYGRSKDSFMVALVELDENDQPINQKARDRVEKAHEREPRKRTRTLSQDVAMMCNNPDFWAWINTETDGGVVDGDQAATWLRQTLGIQSRRELDHDRDLAQRFHREIRRPFVEWQEG